MSSIWAKGCMLMIVCVCYLTQHDYLSLVDGESHGTLYLLYKDANAAQFSFNSITIGILSNKSNRLQYVVLDG